MHMGREYNISSLFLIYFNRAFSSKKMWGSQIYVSIMIRYFGISAKDFVQVIAFENIVIITKTYDIIVVDDNLPINNHIGRTQSLVLHFRIFF